MDLVDGSSSFDTVNGYPLYQVHFGRKYIYLIENLSESVLNIDNTLWPTYYCDHYIPFWVSRIYGTIEVGEGTCIGYDKFDSLPRILNIDVTDILIMSYTTADWLFDIPKNTTSACPPNETNVGSGSGPTKIRTTKTTTPEFASTTISSTDTTTPEFVSTTISSTDTTTLESASTTVSSTDTTTPEVASTSINSTDTTTPEFASTTISSTDTTTPDFASTPISSTDTTPEFASTTINSTDTTKSEFASTTISSSDKTTPALDLTGISTAETTTPEFAPTTISSTDTTTPALDLTGISTTETTTPGFASTTINSTDTTTRELDLRGISTAGTTTPGFDPTTISTIISTATTSSRTTGHSSTKTPCTCSCNNFTMTEDELIRKIALLKSELSVDRKQTNRYRRSLVSAEDDRPSSKYIGTFGIVVLVVICTLIVLMDLQHCACFMFHKKK
ncbi:Hypothetical predicted protein [Mytilus galloprovincialis]|uniref:Uncharacterized protein n=1 Tax=Mytilus galloprovincialis TaxID=29158 RepID=A0A8B6CDE9_MYTGA|nr:Hypothetical predicted protein [Mytilus galloprovincialis]